MTGTLRGVSNKHCLLSNKHCLLSFFSLGFGPDRIQTLVSMATNSSHRVIMEKTVLPLFLSCFSSNPFYTCR